MITSVFASHRRCSSCRIFLYCSHLNCIGGLRENSRRAAGKESEAVIWKHCYKGIKSECGNVAIWSRMRANRLSLLHQTLPYGHEDYAPLFVASRGLRAALSCLHPEENEVENTRKTIHQLWFRFEDQCISVVLAIDSYERVSPVFCGFRSLITIHVLRFTQSQAHSPALSDRDPIGIMPGLWLSAMYLFRFLPFFLKSRSMKPAAITCLSICEENHKLSESPKSKSKTENRFGSSKSDCVYKKSLEDRQTLRLFALSF